MTAASALREGETVDDAPTVMPMFPLGTVLVPSMVLPLHVFEERYRRLVDDCLAGEPEFGVVLIERGSEVGGGDVRTSVGTVARMIEAAETPDGRYALITVGSRRIRVERWLEDDPYPRAEVRDWPDEQPAPDDPGLGRPDLVRLRDETLGRLRRALALQTELGESAAAATAEVTADPVAASHQMAALAPIGAHDRQRLLATPGAAGRMAELREALDSAIEVFEARLAEG